MSDAHDLILSVRDLVKDYPAPRRLFGRRGEPNHAVRGVSFDVPRGQTLAIVGESGSGKTTIAKMLMGFETPTEGEVTFDGRSLVGLNGAPWRALRRDLQYVFQDPYASLPAHMTVEAIVAEPLQIHGLGDRASRRSRAAELLEMVGLDPALGVRYPHQFSGGQRQRVGIARALALEPKMLLLDEPVSALDVSVQAQVINLLVDLQTSLGLSYVFIAHDLAVVRHIAQEVAVMYRGEIVEHGPCARVFEAPEHAYTQQLLRAIPRPDPRIRRRTGIPDEGAA